MCCSTIILPTDCPNGCGSYISRGVLNYYRTEEPQYYLRSHSRDMAFRLSQGDIFCNLDADNFQGKGFARFMPDAFGGEKNIFIYQKQRSRNR